ncbi:MAG: transcription antitermination factor NusB [Fidelibacterota bacterium]|jgi:N utilization substance protein B|nr:transcription antitermination factor NusB [Candidatus Neomarinimicrobiota bacterium]|tara:strand:+ start:2830 stop:3267 length:438 start_codon:yes stop_codon:yes gene_type:complete
MIKNTHPRRIAREAVLQALYASAMTGEDSEKILKDVFKRRSYEPDLIKYITDLFESAMDNKEWCEDQIKSRLNNWEFDRVALLDRLLLIVAISEIYFIEDVPPKVSISEAIEIAKIYCNEDSSSFVNGVLDNVYKTMPSGTKEKN